MLSGMLKLISVSQSITHAVASGSDDDGVHTHPVSILGDVAIAFCAVPVTALLPFPTLLVLIRENDC